MNPAAHDTRWTGPCQICWRERVIQTRVDWNTPERHLAHAGKPVCDECAPREHHKPSAAGLVDLTAERARRRTPALEEIAGRLEAIDLAPVIDHQLCRVLALCPVCGSPDPMGIWRSLCVATYGGLRIVCSGGCSDERVHDALRQLLIPQEPTARPDAA